MGLRSPPSLRWSREREVLSFLAGLLLLGSSSSWAGKQVLLTQSSRVGLTDKKATELLGRLEAALSKELGVLRVNLDCQGERACLVAKVKEAGRDAVVSVSLAMSLKSIIVDLEAVSTSSGAVLAQANFKVKPTDVSLPDAVGSFARSLGEQLDAEARAALEAKRVADAPVKVALLPPLADVPVVTFPATPPSRAPIVITGVAAGVALVASAVLLGVALSTQAQLPPRDSTRDPISLEQVQRLVEGANTAYTGALIAGGAAGALSLTAIILGVTSK